MRNIDTLSGIIIDWAKPMIDDIALQIVNGSDSITRANAWIRKYFPVSQNYSIWNDISFLALPLLSVSITPFLENAVNKIGITD